MDQRADDQHTPLNTAALNPAYVPGLMPSLAAAPEAAKSRQGAAGPEPDAGDAAADEPGTAAPAADAETEAKVDAESEAESQTEAESDAADPGEGEEGPTLLLSDRRGSITADRSGIRLQLDGEEAEFGWDELSAVEYATARWTRRFTITLHLTGPRTRWFRTDVQAPDRPSLAQWSEQLEEVLNAYFEE
ncbi:hypothetical protein [Streptomyces sp. CBMA152]|uniref:hypothetical protein n=1 Tax=Streptomyces sp. CBMA152 TaxID=1896312 RepID=UPI0016613C66|nr:hypothetical protein [Streptomyces sp. CBMA152]MBD0741447.1 hypothetical protein [Streptomyces sp. CBMA152]